MMRAMLLFFVIGVISLGVFAGCGQVAVSYHSNWSPRDYTVQDGGCIVYPKGDPLYDEHYAKNVNLPNCEAYQMQEQAQYTEKLSERVEWNTNQGKTGVYVILGVVASVLALLVIATIKG